MYDYDLVVIGGGPGGYAAAIRASQFGLKAALVEESDIGGTCLNRGCIPTKSLLHSAELYHSLKNCLEFGIVAKDICFDYEKVASKKDSVVKQLKSGVEYLVKNSGCKILRGHGTILDRHTVEVSGKDVLKVTAGKILVASGSKPARPPIPGINSPGILDSDNVLTLKECPESAIIIGGGVIGVEFATVFNSFGCKVIIIEMADSILPGIDNEISTILKRSLEMKGVVIHNSARVISVKSETRAECTFEIDGKIMNASADSIIIAAGRKPLSDGMGLDKAGIEVEHGFVKVNDRMETSVEGIYAIGDVTGKVMLAHVATEQGLIAAANIAGKHEKMAYDIIPSCIYTAPEIATVGLTESEAMKRGCSLKIGRFPVSANGKSMLMGEREGIAKIISDYKTGEILGAHIIGPRATDMISEISVAMKLESTVEEVATTIHPHPTVNEIVMEAFHDIEGLCIHKGG